MSAHAREAKSYGSHLEFYENVYGHALKEVRAAGRSGATMFRAEQSAGDWSDAESPDLIIASLDSQAVGCRIDLGAGLLREATITPGSYILIPPGTATTIMMDGAHKLRVLGVPYKSLQTLCLEDSCLPVDGDFGLLHTRFLRKRSIGSLLDRFWFEAASGNAHGALLVDAILLQFAGELLRLRDGGFRSHSSGLATWQLRRVTEYVEARLGSEMSLVELAALVRLSPNHFCTAFRISLGEPPHRYVVRRRIERAKEMLADPKLSVTEVALAVGFGSSAHFATSFREAVGTTPSCYRRDRLS